MSGLRLVRNSEIKTYKRCRLKWHWNYGLELEPTVAAPPLRFGELVHLALERYYIPGRKRGPHPAATFIALYEEQLEQQPTLAVWDNDERIPADELGHAMLTHYVEHYGKDDHIEVLVPELPFQVTLNHPRTGKPYCTIVGKLDAVYRDLNTGRLGIIDHKTARSIGTGHLPLDEQAGTYFAIAPAFLRAKGMLGKKEKLSHILYNYLRKAKPDPRPFKVNKRGQKLYLNKDGAVSKTQPPKHFHREPVWRGEADRKEITRRIMNTVWEMEQVRKGKLPMLKTPTERCQYDCPFKDPCELHEQGSDWQEMLKLGYTGWEPYADHEVTRKG